jgi:hypothetical protein
MFLQNSKLFRKFTMSDNFFRGTALRNRAAWSDALRWPRCCLYSGSCEHPGIDWWPFRKLGAVQASEMTVLVHNCRCKAHLAWPKWDPPVCDLQFPRRTASQRRPACTPTATYAADFFQTNFNLHSYNVEKWAASWWNHRKLRIGRRQLG